MSRKMVISLVLVGLLTASFAGCNDNNALREADKGIEIIPSNQSSVVSRNIDSSNDSSAENSNEVTESSVESSIVEVESSIESNVESSEYSLISTTRENPIKIGEWASYKFTYGGKDYNAEMRIVSMTDDKDKVESDIKANSGNLPALYVMPNVSNGGVVEFFMECRVIDDLNYSGFPFNKDAFEADGHPNIYQDNDETGNPFLPNVFVMEKDERNHSSGDVISFRVAHRTYVGYKDYVLSYSYNTGKAYFSVK